MKHSMEFLKGALIGLIVAILLAGLIVAAFKLTIDCAPASWVNKLNCLAVPGEQGGCPRACSNAEEPLFYTLLWIVPLLVPALSIVFGVQRLRKTKRP